MVVEFEKQVESYQKKLDHRRQFWLKKAYRRGVSREARVKILITWLWREADYDSEVPKPTPLVPEIKELLLKELPPESRRLQTLRENGIL
jgi:hypothetical protein